MYYGERSTAEMAMAAWAETTSAPALALVSAADDQGWRIIEADNDGMLVLRHNEIHLDTIWTPHSRGITTLTLMNAYSVGYCCPLYQIHERTILVPHGARDLVNPLDQGRAEVNDDAGGWRMADDAGEVFVDALSEGVDVCPWSDGLPVPEDVSEDGLAPIVLIRMAGGRIDDVCLVHGSAHVVVVNKDGEGLDRGPHLRLLDDLGQELLVTNWTGPAELESLPSVLVKRLSIHVGNTGQPGLPG